MNSMSLFAAAPAVSTHAMFKRTISRTLKVEFINSFNNAVFVRREAVESSETETGEAYYFRATDFAAEGVARGGFNVYRVYANLFIARRSKRTIFA